MFLASKSQSNQDLPILFIGRAESGDVFGTNSIDLSLGVLTDGILNTPSAGDFIVGYAVTGDSASDLVVPAGFTKVQMNEVDVTNTPAITDGYYYLFYGYYNPANTVFSVKSSFSASRGYMSLFVYRSVDPSTAFDVSVNYTALNTSGTYSSQPSVTPLTAGAVILSGAYSYSQDLTAAENGLQTEPANNTNYFFTTKSLGISDPFNHNFAFAEYRGWVSGTYTPDDFGPAAGDGVTFPEVGTFTIVLRPKYSKSVQTTFAGGNSVFVNTTDYDGSGNYTITVDSNTTFGGIGIRNGDVVVLAITRTGFPTLYSISNTGFTELYGDDASSTYEARIYYATFTGTPLSITVGSFNLGSLRPFVYHMLSVRYPNTATPLDVGINVEDFSYINATGNPQTQVVDCAAVTTNTDNAIVLNGLLLGGSGDSGIGVSAPDLSVFLNTPSNMTTAAPELVAGTGSNPDVSYTAAAYAKVTTAGTFDPATWGTVTLEPDQNLRGVSYTLAIKPR